MTRLLKDPDRIEYAFLLFSWELHSCASVRYGSDAAPVNGYEFPVRDGYS